MRKNWVWITGALLAIAAVLLLRKHEPPVVPVSVVARRTVVSNLPTNGRVEPVEWESIRAETSGLVKTLTVKEGDSVSRGAMIARVSQPGIQEELSSARARVAESKSALQTLQAGGRSGQLADLDAELARARFDHEFATKEYDSLVRLEAKQAATHVEVLAAKQRVDAAALSMQTLATRRQALVGPNDVSAGRARLAGAEADVQSAVAKAGTGVVRSPIAGIVYSLPARVGAYVNAGDLIANVGEIDRLRVKVFVDEPELGRVRIGLPVRITWDGLPGRVWDGAVERMPTEIVALNSRQVGEVWVTIANTHHDLVPGTTVNAEVRTAVAQAALTIPKAALRRDRGPVGVFVVRNGRMEWQAVVTGVSDVTNTSIRQGLKEGEQVVLPTDLPVKEGDRVRTRVQ